MKRAELENLGLTKEQVDAVMGINGKDIETAKGNLTEVSAERNSLKTQLGDRDKQIEELKKLSKGNEELQKQIEALQAENKAARIGNAVEKALTAAKAKNLTAVKALLKDMDKAELSEDGTIKGLKEQIEALKAAEDTKFLFDSEKGKKPAIKGVTPADPGDGKPQGITKEQFNRMGYKERLKLYTEDRETYDALVNGTE